MRIVEYIRLRKGVIFLFCFYKKDIYSCSSMIVISLFKLLFVYLFIGLLGFSFVFLFL